MIGADHPVARHDDGDRVRRRPGRPRASPRGGRWLPRERHSSSSCQPGCGARRPRPCAGTAFRRSRPGSRRSRRDRRRNRRRARASHRRGRRARCERRIAVMRLQQAQHPRLVVAEIECAHPAVLIRDEGACRSVCSVGRSSDASRISMWGTGAAGAGRSSKDASRRTLATGATPRPALPAPPHPALCRCHRRARARGRYRRREGVRLAQRAHGDVAGRPLADAGEGDERPPF